MTKQFLSEVETPTPLCSRGDCVISSQYVVPTVTDKYGNKIHDTDPSRTTRLMLCATCGHTWKELI